MLLALFIVQTKMFESVPEKKTNFLSMEVATERTSPLKHSKVWIKLSISPEAIIKTFPEEDEAMRCSFDILFRLQM